jgi:transcriptional regulator with XRE-family HTH domain
MPADKRTPSAIDLHVGKRLRAARELRNLAQERLAEMLHVSFQQVQKYEAGKNRLSASRLHQAARLLALPIEFFYAGLDDPETASVFDEAVIIRTLLRVRSSESRELLLKMALALADREESAEDRRIRPKRFRSR